MHLPTYALVNIALFTDTPTRSNLLTTSQDFYDAVKPLILCPLYRTVEVGKDNLPAILEGLNYKDIPASQDVTGNPAHVNAISRKLNLLDSCETLIFESLPSPDSCQRLTDVVFGTEFGFSAARVPFRNVKYVQLRSQVIFDLVLWSDENLKPIEDHPFITRLGQMCKPRSICVFLHHLNLKEREAYVGRVLAKIPLGKFSSTVQTIMRQDLESHYVSLFHEQAQVLMEIDRWLSEDHPVLTIHNSYNNDDVDLEISNIRLFSTHVPPDLFSVGYRPHGNSHRYSERWIRSNVEYESLLAKATPRPSAYPGNEMGISRKTEFVLPRLSEDVAQMQLDTENAENLRGSIDRYVPKKSPYAVKVSAWGEAEPCVCCGKK
ncbi:hypothetical protein L486_00137 [Kwoniella mangroviensis CBS 10435]|uniref:Uncharacterized protein n=1 Tax=Kwoniella mangroviensis CBS 10435 TaxID=1331196 RepID=A0A1B9IYL8_9TREE|nr:hypothetical protein L486_00137 [Kwoniella mangroviensis CBS 10435]